MSDHFDGPCIIETFKGRSKISIDRLKPAYTLDFVNHHKIKSKNNNDSFISSRNISTSTSAATVLPLVEYGRTQAGKPRIGQLVSQTLLFKASHFLASSK